MKIHMFNWAFEKMDLPAWFKHGEDADVSDEQIMNLFKSGINIMLYHSKMYNDKGKLLPTTEITLFVDNKRFTQR